MSRLMLPLLLLLLAVGPAWGRTTHGLSDMATEQQSWWGDMATGYVVAGCLPTVPAPAGLTLTVPPCQAYGLETDPRRQYYLSEPTARPLTLPATTGMTWLAAHGSVAEAVPGWTRVPGTHYVWQAGASRPPLPPDGGVLLARLEVASGAITGVGDFRPDNPLRGPINALSPLYGVRGDCTTDDTAGLQAAINAAAWQDRRLWIPKQPGDCYLFTKLRLDYDATANPTYPPLGVDQGQMTIACDQESGTVSNIAPPPQNTYLKSTDTTGPAISADKAGVAGNPLRNLKLSGCSLEANNTSYVLSLKGLSSMAVVDNMYVVQSHNNGNGFLCEDCFLLTMRNVFVYHTSNGIGDAANGVGLTIRNAKVAGGVYNLDNVTGRGFGGGTCVQIGHEDMTLARAMNTFSARGLQGTNCRNNIRVMGGAANGVLDSPHIEVAHEHGLWFSHGARSWTVISPYFVNPDAGTADLRIGYSAGTPTEAGASGITVISPVFSAVKNIGFYRDSNAYVARTTLINPAFAAVTEGAGIGIQCAADPHTILNGMVVTGAGFPYPPSPSLFFQNYRNCEKLPFLEDPNFVRVGVGFSIDDSDDSDLPPPFQIRRWFVASATLDFGIVPAQQCEIQTFAAPGAAVTQFLAERWPGGATMGSGTWTMYVPGPDTLAVRVCNVGTGPTADFASGVFGALFFVQE